MKVILICLLSLQLLVSLSIISAFRKLGDINHASANGSVYLIDKNSLFIRGFTASGPLQFSTVTSTGSISITTSQALSNANMILALNASLADSFLTAAQIWVTLVSVPSVILSTLSIPNNVAIPCSAEYLGRFQGQHQLDGFAFIDRPGRRFYVLGFNLDGNAPAVYFWLGTSTTPSSSGVIASRAGTFNKLGAYQNAEFIVTPPKNSVFSNFRSISVWCEAFSVNFGHLVIPVGSYSDSFTCASYGSFEMGLTPSVHSTSGSVFVTGPQTFSIDNFNTDGSGPRAYFWIGTSSNEHVGTTINNEAGSSAVLRTYTNEKIVIALPVSNNMCNLNFFGVYCTQASVTFGLVRLSSYSCSGCPDTCVTNNGGTGSLPFQCLELSEVTFANVRLQYQLDVANSEAHFRITVCNLASENYVAFGLSGSDSAVQMVPDGDPCICRLVNGMPVCQDYSLTSYTQCASTGGPFTGACPDTVQTPTGTEGCLNVGMTQESGATTFSFTRKITSSDTNRDRNFTLNSPQTIIWAKGGTFLSSVNNERWVLRHQPSDRANRASPIAIDLNATSTCTSSYQCTSTTVTVTAWEIPPVCANATTPNISAAIGETGGTQGYPAITSQSGWGIAWYLNGYLIPELYLVRNTTYTFLVTGGDDPAQPAYYHPFYITDSSTGGIESRLRANQSITETIYAGLVLSPNQDQIVSRVIGPYCSYQQPLNVSPDDFSTFTAYQSELNYVCTSTNSPGMFQFTPNSSTPNLLYYQCATHQLLGWKIRIVDNLDQCHSTTTTPPSTTGTTTSPTLNSASSIYALPIALYGIAFTLYIFLFLY